MTRSLTDIDSDIIQTQILACLDGPSLATTATSSSYLQNLCSDENLWHRICKSTWPSTTHPRVHGIISTFPYGHRSFFHDAFPILAINSSTYKKNQQLDCLTSYPAGLPELVSAIDIHYQNEIIYSTVDITDTSTKDFLSSALWIELKNDKSIIKRSIDLKVDEISEEALLQLKESLRLNWVVMGMSWKRAGNLSSVKPVRVKEDLLTNEILVQYVTILPGCDPKEMVRCNIDVVLGVVAAGLQVKMVILSLQNLNSWCLNGYEFLVITQRAIMEENKLIRKMVADNYQEMMISYKEFKKMKREKRKEKENRKKVAVKNKYTHIFVWFCICVYFLVLCLQSLGLGLS